MKKQYKYLISFVMVISITLMFVPIVLADNNDLPKNFYTISDYLALDNRPFEVASGFAFHQISYNFASLNHIGYYDIYGCTSDDCDNQYDHYTNLVDEWQGVNANFVYEFYYGHSSGNLYQTLFSTLPLILKNDGIYAPVGVTLLSSYNTGNNFMIKEGFNEVVGAPRKIFNFTDIDSNNLFILYNFKTAVFYDEFGGQVRFDDNDTSLSYHVDIIPERFGINMDYSNVTDIDVKNAYLAIKLANYNDILYSSFVISEMSDNQSNSKFSYKFYTQNLNDSRLIYRHCEKDSPRTLNTAGMRINYIFQQDVKLETFVIPYSYMNLKPGKTYYLHIFLCTDTFWKSRGGSLEESMGRYLTIPFSFKVGTPTAPYNPPEWGNGGNEKVDDGNGALTPTLPNENASFGTWAKWLFGSISSLFTVATNGIKDISSSAKGFFGFISASFTFLPSEIWALIILGVATVIILRIFGR